AETESQLATIQQQMLLLEARTEAEMQEIRQAQEAREAERKRLAEEWRTAKELDLKSMEYQHAETLAIIEGTTQITAEAAKTGMLKGIQGSAGRVDLGGKVDGQAVSDGIQALRGFREKIAPPTTRFLPTSPEAGGYVGRGGRVQLEELRLERIPNVEYELTTRRGEIAG
ncbi:MAG: hypothetical protein GY803_21900, partial [Chloroflexi bacterium]|nr:hypothetical protein [Chloroflexota bacterium]